MRVRGRRWTAGRVALVLAGLCVAVLAAPLVLREAPDRRLVGPRLDELSYHETAFTNGGLDLAGLVFLPEGDGPFPGAVIIHGSGPSRRDNPWYLSVAESLQAAGIAVLLPDKRGSERSGGDWRGATLAELATDTAAAVAHLGTEAAVDRDAIGVVGMSQGGWIAPLVAEALPDLAFVATVSGAAVTAEEQLLYEEVHNIVEIGSYRCLAELVAPLTARRIRQGETWRPLAGFDPIPHWGAVEAPVFAAFGDGDTNVPVEESVARLEALGRDIAIRVYPEGGHAIRDPATGRVQAGFLSDLVGFVGAAILQ